jgi:hypothetical protein
LNRRAFDAHQSLQDFQGVSFGHTAPFAMNYQQVWRGSAHETLRDGG